MDVMELVKKVTDTLSGDKSMLSLFNADPAKIIRQIAGIDLSDDIIKKVIEGVKEKLGDLLGEGAGQALDAVKDAAENVTESKGGILDKIKSLF